MTTKYPIFDYLSIGKRTIDMELNAIQSLAQRIDESFQHACDLIHCCKARTIVTGMGKSGHIGHKIAATLASTGTPAFFVHPGEASHGDLGMITPEDVVIAISNSGNSAEVVTLLPILKRLQVPLISMTGNPESTLAKAASVNLDVGVDCEACPLDLAPTSSTTVTLVMGDAIAVALLEAKGFTAEDFAFSHPGGSLGKRLLLRVSDIMHKGDQIPAVFQGALLSEALMEMTHKGLGMTTIIDENKKLIGIFTDGDLRRTLDTGEHIHSLNIDDVMSTSPTTIPPNKLAAEALSIMQNYSITALVVIDTNQRPTGIIHMHDLLRAGML
ncbi:D-arabinose 5-phosphate isomerase [Candidatus Endobugula sertula]|uniref:Arabinose 5-phosphate isomerase n=1 Tax=Candidatus Endobugula sertula TaxID=62101 RepID=A0A1D2QQL1_9GAMM|nr:D-arabinose 5-phosphate isomerase [Candidatus Endobugula sertula]